MGNIAPSPPGNWEGKGRESVASHISPRPELLWSEEYSLLHESYICASYLSPGMPLRIPSSTQQRDPGQVGEAVLAPIDLGSWDPPGAAVVPSQCSESDWQSEGGAGWLGSGSWWHTLPP